MNSVPYPRAWRVQSRPPAAFLAAGRGVPSPIAAALHARGLKRRAQIKEYFAPTFSESQPDPFLLKDMAKAVARLLKARAINETVGIYGDYDVDGVAATALLSGLLDKLGIKHHWYLPDRETEGYGFKEKGLRALLKAGVSLIITVDCGTANEAAVALARQLGCAVIILDHHEPPLKLPKAAALVNPKRRGEKYPFRDLAATGVVFKFACAVAQKVKAVTPVWLKWQLDLVALATIADRMPLLAENRTLVKYGLMVLPKTKRLGLKSLITVSRLGGRELTATDAGFALAPRLNAAGRMDHANGALLLLLAQEAATAAALAKRLEQQNRQRQASVERMVKEITSQLEREPAPLGVIIAASPHWLKGLLGLVASKLTERYGVPSFLFQKGPVKAVASARSLPGYDVMVGIRRVRRLLIDYGGHAYAAGLTVANENFDALVKRLQADVARHGRIEAGEILIDARLKAADLTPALFEWTLKMAPFGDANPVPLFLIEGALILRHRGVGNGDKHLKFTFEIGGRPFSGIAFNGSENLAHRAFHAGASVDLVFEPLVNEWQGEKHHELRIIDLKLSRNS